LLILFSTATTEMYTLSLTTLFRSGSKVKTCHEIGYGSTLIRHGEDISEDALIREIQELNANDEIDGILVQLPLPKHIHEQAIIKDRKSTRLNSSHVKISYAVFCLK